MPRNAVLWLLWLLTVLISRVTSSTHCDAAASLVAECDRGLLPRSVCDPAEAHHLEACALSNTSSTQTSLSRALLSNVQGKAGKNKAGDEVLVVTSDQVNLGEDTTFDPESVEAANDATLIAEREVKAETDVQEKSTLESAEKVNLANAEKEEKAATAKEVAAKTAETQTKEAESDASEAEMVSKSNERNAKSDERSAKSDQPRTSEDADSETPTAQCQPLGESTHFCKRVRESKAEADEACEFGEQRQSKTTALGETMHMCSTTSASLQEADEACDTALPPCPSPETPVNKKSTERYLDARVEDGDFNTRRSTYIIDDDEVTSSSRRRRSGSTNLEDASHRRRNGETMIWSDLKTCGNCYGPRMEGCFISVNPDDQGVCVLTRGRVKVNEGPATATTRGGWILFEKYACKKDSAPEVWAVKKNMLGVIEMSPYDHSTWQSCADMGSQSACDSIAESLSIVSNPSEVKMFAMAFAVN